MNARKERNMMEAYKGFEGSQTVNAILSQIPDELLEQLSGKQIGMVMNAIKAAYNDGKASTGAEMIDSNAVYINSLGKIIEWNEDGAVNQ